MLYMKSSFPKRDKRHAKKCDYDANAKLIDCVLEKSFSYMYISTYKFIKTTFPNHDLGT